MGVNGNIDSTEGVRDIVYKHSKILCKDSGGVCDEPDYSSNSFPEDSEEINESTIRSALNRAKEMELPSKKHFCPFYD